MKTIKYLSSLALLSALALASCTNDQDPAKTDHLPEGIVYLTGSIAGQNAARATINTNGSGTFTDGDVWGMSTLVNNQVVNDNMEYTYATTKLFWEDLSRTNDVTFLAQYPRQAEIADLQAYDFDVAAAAAADFDTADLLAASTSGNRQTNSSAIPLQFQFRHLMHRLEVTLSVGQNMVAADLDGASISLQNMKGAARVDLTTCTVDPALASTGSAYAPRTALLNASTSTASATFYVAPQTVTAGDEWLYITVGSNTYIYKVPAVLTDNTPLTELKDGQCLHLSLMLQGKHEVILSGANISAWQEQGSASIEQNYTDGYKIVSTLKELYEALTREEDNVDHPARYILGKDISMTGMQIKEIDESNHGLITIKGCKVLDGGGNSLTGIYDKNEGGIAPKITMESSSLVLQNIKMVSQYSDNFITCETGGSLTMDHSVTFFTSMPTSIHLINVSDGGNAIIDGTIFTNKSTDKAQCWIRMTKGGIVELHDINIENKSDYIEFYGLYNPTLKLEPGLTHKLNIKFDDVSTGSFEILSTGDPFSPDDPGHLSIASGSKLSDVDISDDTHHFEIESETKIVVVSNK